MPRKRVPTVSAADLNIVQLDPQTRRIINRRSRKAAQREWAPVLAADRQALQIPKQEYRNQAQSAKGATAAMQSSLVQALAGLKGSGLGGRYLQQTKGEFTSRMSDAAAALPSLLAGAAEERAKSSQEARQTLLQDRASMQQSAAAKANQGLKEARTAGASFLKEQENSGDSRDEEDKESWAQANEAIKDALSIWQENEPIEIDGEMVRPKELNPLKTVDDWRRFAHGLESEYEGVTLDSAMKAIDRLLRERKRAAPVTEAIRAGGF